MKIGILLADGLEDLESIIAGMKLGILQTGEVRDNLQAEHGHYPEMFKWLLADYNFDYAVYDVRTPTYPARFDECDGYIITGSRHSTYEAGLDWIAPLKKYIADIHEQTDIPLLGICFGHQIVADALGGRSSKSPNGWGLGLHRWQVTNRPAWMDGDASSNGDASTDSNNTAPDHLSLYVSHQDQVEQLPPAACRVLVSDFCRNAGFAIANRVFCLQGHPEFTSEFTRALIGLRVDDISPQAYEERMHSCRTPADTALCARWIAQFFFQAGKN